jgi:hypothetical protein
VFWVRKTNTNSSPGYTPASGCGQGPKKERNNVKMDARARLRRAPAARLLFIVSIPKAKLEINSAATSHIPRHEHIETMTLKVLAGMVLRLASRKTIQLITF